MCNKRNSYKRQTKLIVVDRTTLNTCRTRTDPDQTLEERGQTQTKQLGNADTTVTPCLEQVTTHPGERRHSHAFSEKRRGVLYRCVTLRA